MVAVLLPLTACANRPASPVAVERPYDSQLSCGQLQSEISAAGRMVGSYRTDLQQQNARNGQAVVGAVFMPVALMNMDTGGASDREMAAYSQRIAHLETLAKQKDCP